MPNNLRVTTVKATAQWAQLFEPNKYGNYSISLLYDPNDPEHAAQLEEFEAVFQDEYSRACAVARKKELKCDARPWRKQVDSEGNETGMVELRLKQAANVTTRDGRTLEFSVVVVKADAKTRWSADDGLIGNGSVVRASFDWNPHGGGPGSEFGLGTRLRAVQVIEHVPYDNGFGFDAVEGSLVSEDELVAADAVNRGDEELPF